MTLGRTMCWVVVTMLATGCLGLRRHATQTLPNMEASALLDTLDGRTLDWSTLGLRLEATASAMGNQGTFTLNVRMAKDSVIWMSISPALGVEAARVLLTPDSVQVLSKLPGNRWVFSGNYGMLADAMQAPVNFDLVQSLLIGRPLMMEPGMDEFASKIQGASYVLTSKYNRNVRRLVGVDDKEVAPDDSLGIVMTDRRAERLLDKADDELVVKRYWVNGKTFDPEKDVVDDLLRQRTLTVERSDFEGTDLGRLPYRIRMTGTGPEGLFDALIYFKRRRPGRAYDFPFSIPEGFERKTSL